MSGTERGGGGQVCVCVCVLACVRACVRACVCVWRAREAMVEVSVAVGMISHMSACRMVSPAHPSTRRAPRCSPG
jgi:hypothetical protein